MARVISITRRRVGMVDISLQNNPAAESYDFSAASNFDAVPTSFQVVPARIGYKSSSVIDNAFNDNRFKGKTRFIFDPSDYTTSVPAVDDTKPFWVNVTQNNFDGSSVTSSLHLVLPYSTTPNRAYNLVGNLDTSVLELQLPQLSNAMYFTVDGTDNAFMSFDENGTEFKVPNLSTDFQSFFNTLPSFTQLFLRGSASPTSINVALRMVNNTMMLIHLLLIHNRETKCRST